MTTRTWEGICTRSAGCVLHASHRGACKIAQIEEEDYEVEIILRQRRRGGVDEYLTKWKNWPEADATWEKKTAFENAAEILADWERAQVPQATKKRKPPRGCVHCRRAPPLILRRGQGQQASRVYAHVAC